MLIWRGFGILVPIIVFACSLVANLLTNHVAGANYWRSNAWPFGSAMIAAGIVLLVADLALSRQPPRTLIDEATGERIEQPRRHDLFFISIKWWALIAAVAGVAMIASGTAPG